MFFFKQINTMYTSYGDREIVELTGFFNDFKNSYMRLEDLRASCNKLVNRANCDCSDCGGERLNGNCVIDRLNNYKSEIINRSNNISTIRKRSTSSLDSDSDSDSSIRISLV